MIRPPDMQAYALDLHVLTRRMSRSTDRVVVVIPIERASGFVLRFIWRSAHDIGFQRRVIVLHRVLAAILLVLVRDPDQQRCIRALGERVSRRTRFALVFGVKGTYVKTIAPKSLPSAS